MTPEQLVPILREAYGFQPPWYVVTLVAAFVGALVAYFGPLLGERAKITAVMMNLNKLVEQAREITKAAEDIKSQIAGGLWLEQKRWDLKKDLYTRLLDNLAVFIVRMDGLGALRNEEQDEQTVKLVGQYFDAAMTAYREILQATWTAALFLNEPALEALQAMRGQFSETNKLRDGVEDVRERLVASARKAYTAILEAGMDDLITLKIAAEARS